MAYESSLGITGAVLGGLGNLYQAYEARKEAKRQRAELEQAIRGVTGSNEYNSARLFVNQFFGQGYMPLNPTPEDQAKVNAYNATGNRSLLPTPELDQLTQDFTKGLRAAQASRGLFESQAGAGAEASGLSAYRANMAASLLPQLLYIGEAPVRLRAMAKSGMIPSGPGLGSAFLSGFTQGGLSGAQLGIDMNQYNSQIYGQEQLYANAPMAGYGYSPNYGLGGIGSTGVNFASPRSQRF